MSVEFSVCRACQGPARGIFCDICAKRFKVSTRRCQRCRQEPGEFKVTVEPHKTRWWCKQCTQKHLNFLGDVINYEGVE